MQVAVLGGGPAAAAAALGLARGGVDVTLYQPERRGEKPCGGALPSYLLDELNGFDTSSLASVAVDRAVLENASGRQLELHLEGLRVFRRGDLDPALIEAARLAGARIRCRKARALEWRGGLPLVGTDFGQQPYDWIIGADGARGLSRRSLGLEPRGESVGLGASIPGIEAAAITLSFPGLADAYLWIFPRPGGCSVGIAYSASELSPQAARACLSSFLERHLGLPFDAVQGARYRYPIPVYGDWSHQAVARGLDRRVLLVGDAAALADPLTREGIRYAVRSGCWAAEALLDDRPEKYAGRLRRELHEDLSRAGRARDLFYGAPLGQWMVPVCRHHAGVRRVLGDLLACRQPYLGLKKRLLGSVLSWSEPRPGRQAP